MWCPRAFYWYAKPEKLNRDECQEARNAKRIKYTNCETWTISVQQTRDLMTFVRAWFFFLSSVCFRWKIQTAPHDLPKKSSISEREECEREREHLQQQKHRKHKIGNVSCWMELLLEQWTAIQKLIENEGKEESHWTQFAFLHSFVRQHRRGIRTASARAGPQRPTTLFSCVNSSFQPLQPSQRPHTTTTTHKHTSNAFTQSDEE